MCSEKFYEIVEGDVSDQIYKKPNVCNIVCVDTGGKPGTIEFCEGVPCVANLFLSDNPLYHRKACFKSCLDRLCDDLIKVYKDIHIVVFPYEIGCRVAGDNWYEYERLMAEFAFDLITEFIKPIMVYNLDKMKNTDKFYEIYPFIQEKKIL